MTKNNFQCTFIFFKYCPTASAVPEKAGIFNVPITFATGKLGNKVKDNGVCINPPPPTIESTKPAMKAIKHKRDKVSKVIINNTKL